MQSFSQILMFYSSSEPDNNKGKDREDQQDEVVADEEDMVDIFKRQIKEMQTYIEELPIKFRQIDESLRNNLVEWEITVDKRAKVLEEHVTHLNNKLDHHKKRLINDKDVMREQVDSNTKLFEALKDDYSNKSGVIKSLSGTTAWLLEAICIKAFLEDAASEERESEIISKSQFKNFAIENSFPSLNRDATSLTISLSKSGKIKNNHRLKAHGSLDTRHTRYQEIYVYRDVNQETAENAYYK